MMPSSPYLDQSSLLGRGTKYNTFRPPLDYPVAAGPLFAHEWYVVVVKGVGSFLAGSWRKQAGSVLVKVRHCGKAQLALSGSDRDRETLHVRLPRVIYLWDRIGFDGLGLRPAEF